MPKTKYVVRVYKVDIPDDRTAIDKTIRDHYPSEEDALIVINSDAATAMFLSYHDMVEIYDTYVRDTFDPEQFETTE
jgi:hypothetical protein